MKFLCRVPYGLTLYEETPESDDQLRLSWLELSSASPVPAEQIRQMRLYNTRRLALEISVNDKIYYILVEDFDRPLEIMCWEWQYLDERGRTRAAEELEPKVMRELRKYLRPNIRLVA